MAAMRQIPLTCSGHTRPVVYLAFSQITPNGYFLLSACKDGKPMLRQGETGDWIGTFVGHKGAVWGVALNNDATKAATGAADFMAKLWDSVTGEELHSFTHQHIVKSVHFNQDGTHLLTGSNEKLLRIFDIEKPEADPQVFSGHTSAIKQALFLNDNKCILSASDDKTIRLWDKTSGEEVKKLDLPGSPTSMEVSPDGTVLLATYGCKVSFWDVDSFSVIKEIDVPTTVNSASLHPKKTVFVCGGDDFKMCKYDYESGNLLDSFKGHFGPIHCVRFSPDGELYASGSEDGTLRLWQTNVGQNYGLWRCVTPAEASTADSAENAASGNLDGQQLKAEA